MEDGALHRSQCRGEHLQVVDGEAAIGQLQLYQPVPTTMFKPLAHCEGWCRGLQGFEAVVLYSPAHRQAGGAHQVWRVPRFRDRGCIPPPSTPHHQSRFLRPRIDRATETLQRPPNYISDCEKPRTHVCCRACPYIIEAKLRDVAWTIFLFLFSEFFNSYASISSTVRVFVLAVSRRIMNARPRWPRGIPASGHWRFSRHKDTYPALNKPLLCRR
jgi:hypothetical protein